MFRCLPSLDLYHGLERAARAPLAWQAHATNAAHLRSQQRVDLRDEPLATIYRSQQKEIEPKPSWALACLESPKVELLTLKVL